ncbi:MAG: hypothetical protein MJ014_02905 [Methanocorpusculum sp.]|nr:hypothetical protein [Methanocorpusculum sp.]
MAAVMQQNVERTAVMSDSCTANQISFEVSAARSFRCWKDHQTAENNKEQYDCNGGEGKAECLKKRREFSALLCDVCQMRTGQSAG